MKRRQMGIVRRVPITDIECPICGDPIHTDGLIDGVHHIGCGEPLPEDFC